jgi:hypothetical protein
LGGLAVDDGDANEYSDDEKEQERRMDNEEVRGLFATPREIRKTVSLREASSRG